MVPARTETPQGVADANQIPLSLMSTTTKKLRTAKFYESMTVLGFTFDETETLRRAQATLRRWSEAETNGEIERDEDTGKTFRHYGRERGKSPCKDAETRALARVATALSARNARNARGNQLVTYHQGDCRGCSLYVLHERQIRQGEDIGSVYNRGFPVCVS